MPKEKPSSVCKLKQLVIEFGENVFSTNNKILFYKVCEVKVKVMSVKHFSVVRHTHAEKHKMSLLRLQKSKERKNFSTTNTYNFEKNQTSILICAKRC